MNTCRQPSGTQATSTKVSRIQLAYRKQYTIRYDTIRDDIFTD